MRTGRRSLPGARIRPVGPPTLKADRAPPPPRGAEFPPWLGPLQLRTLRPYQVAVRQFHAGRTERPFTGVTRPEPPSLGADHGRGLIEVALARCGRPRSEVESEIEERLRTYESAAGDRRDVAAGEEGGRKGVRNRVRRGR